MNPKKIRNIAIIAHVDHGKTTLIDKLLTQTGSLDERAEAQDRMMDSNDLERERGITILAKNTAISWQDYHINIVDTPGHADFGGEVERVLSMVDSVLLLVDAVDGPMPQTRFVTQKAFAQNLNPIVVINKVDRDGARPDWVIDQVFDLFVSLEATDEQLDFPIIYASALQGYAMDSLNDLRDDMTPLLQTIIDKVPPPEVDIEGPLQMQISSLDYSSYVGAIGIGRITRGTIKRNMQVTIIDSEGKTRNGKVLQVLTYEGLNRIESEDASAGNIVAISGIEKLRISDTVCAPQDVVALPPLTVDEPTVTMTFQVNNSPFAGREGKYLTSRQIKDRLERELIHNVALRVEQQIQDPDKFAVSGRGELHLGILLETMRREGYELAVSRPTVIIKEVNGKQQEPYELLTVDVEENHQGAVMEALGARKGNVQNMAPGQAGRTRLDYIIPSRGLFGFQNEFMSLTSGTGLIYHVFDHYGEKINEEIVERKNGVMMSNLTGKAVAYSIFNLQGRGKMFVEHGTEVYEGMLVGLHARDNDISVNVIKGKQLTNVRASGTDENVVLTPATKFGLEQAITFINSDELVEITPLTIRLRKRWLKEHERKTASRTKVD